MLTKYWLSSQPLKRSKLVIGLFFLIRFGKSGLIANQSSCAFDAIPSVNSFQSLYFLKLTKPLSGSLILMSKRLGSVKSGVFLDNVIDETYLTAFWSASTQA